MRQPEEACLLSPKAIAVAGLSAIAIAASGCGGVSDPEAENPIGFPKLTTTWVSPTYGYSFRHEEGRGPTPATELWDPVVDPPVDASSTYDDPFDLLETGWAAFFKSASTPIPEGVSIDEWVDEHVSGCGGPRSQQAEITIDGQSGRIAECPKTTEADGNRIEATVVAGGRLYLFILLSDRTDYREVFDYFASTIDLRPETAAELSAAFKKRFGEAPWYHHVTEVKMSSEHPTTTLTVTTDFSGNDSLSETICAAAYRFAKDEVGDEIEAVGMVDSEGKEGGCA